MKIFNVIPSTLVCLMAASGPAAQAEWKDATVKKILNETGGAVTLTLMKTWAEGRVGVGPFNAGLGDPEVRQLVPRPLAGLGAGADAEDGPLVEYTIPHGHSAGLYLDDVDQNHFQASFLILDAKGGQLMMFRTRASEPDQEPWLERHYPPREASHLVHGPDMIHLKRLPGRRQSGPAVLGGAGAGLGREAKAAGAGAPEPRRHSAPGSLAGLVTAAGETKGEALGDTKAGVGAGAGALRLVHPKAKPGTEAKASR